MQTKTRNSYPENFLNNQNYILGKTEKKKLLSKFFVERMLYYIMIILSYFNSILYKKETGYAFVVFISTVFIIIFLLFMGIEYFVMIYFYLIVGVFAFTEVIKNFKYEKINNYSELFLLKDYSFFNLFLFLLIIGMHFTVLGINLFIFVIIFIMLFSMEIFKLLFNKNINIFHILFFPIIGLTILCIGIILYISTYFLKAKKTLKYIPDSNLLKRFKILEKNSAENEFYEINLKKY